MGVGKFEKLYGAAGDVKELEYIAALHQTALEGRTDASINAEDIRLFLASRHGIRVTNEEVRSNILKGMGGGQDEDEVLDLMEVVAMLLIPIFKKAYKQEVEGKDLTDGLVPAPNNLLDYALKIILHDNTPDTSYKPLTTELVREILKGYGEHQLASDENLVREMVDAAGGIGSVLDEAAFGKALTEDTDLLDLDNEVSLTTNFDDVNMITKQEEYDAIIEKGGPRSPEFQQAAVLFQQNQQKSQGSFNRIQNLPQIDITSDNYRSKTLTVFLWATFLITYFSYLSDISFDLVTCDDLDQFQYDLEAPWANNVDAILCDAGRSLAFWLLFLIGMSVFGLAFVMAGSTGNSVECRDWRVPLVGAGVVFTAVFSLYASNLSGHLFLDVTSLVLGLIVCYYHVKFSLKLRWPDCLASYHRVKEFLSQSTVFAEMKTKRSAAFKLQAMMNNALKIVTIEDDDDRNLIHKYYGYSIQKFAKKGKEFRTAGGFIWAWRRLYEGKVLSRDGIWIPARLVASNIAQCIVAVFILWRGFDLVAEVERNYGKQSTLERVLVEVNRVFDLSVDNNVVEGVVGNVTTVVSDFLDANQDAINIDCSSATRTAAEVLSSACIAGGTSCSAEEFLCPLLEEASGLSASEQVALLTGSGLNADGLREVSRVALLRAASDAVTSLYPSDSRMIVIPMIVATLAAFLTATFLAATYIPSVTNTVHKLRCGVIPTLRDPRLKQYKVAPDQVAILTGSLFWGAFVSSLVVGSLFGLLTAFYLWQATAYYAQRFTALIVGVLLITLIRLLSLQVTRHLFFRSFYREKPGAANILLLILEWANVALTAGYIFVRMIKLLFVAGAWIGRIDTPLLAPGVGRIGDIELDGYHLVHVKDILSHEAHRHPYIESLGVIYMMKLRYADHFGRRANSVWRLIFVYALMPWLHKYRILTRENQPGPDDSDDDPAATATLRHVDAPSTFLALHPSKRKLVSTIDVDDEAEDAVVEAAQQRIMRRDQSQPGAVGVENSLPEYMQGTEERQYVEELQARIRSLEEEVSMLRSK